MKIWASKRSLREEIADVPGNWLDEFAANRPNDIRKFGDAQNSTLLFRVSAVVDAVEAGQFFRRREEA